MLAQNFKAADELEITEEQKEALIKTLVLLETNRLIHANPSELTIFAMTDEEAPFTGHFNMACWRKEYPCGTVACLGGTAELVGKCSFDGYDDNPGLLSLFNPIERFGTEDWRYITNTQAATALRSYLTTGDPRWDLAVATQ